MGVDYQAIIAIGKEFDERGDAEEFLIENGIATEEEVEDCGGIYEFLESSGIVGGDCLNYYSGDYCYIGYDLSTSDPESFQKSFDEGMESWNKWFPGITPDIIKTVKVY